MASEFDVAHCYSFQFLLMSISLFKASDLQNSLPWILVPASFLGSPPPGP